MSGIKEIIKAVAEKTELTQTKAREVYDALTEVVAEELKTLEAGESLALVNLVTFKAKQVEERTHRNPKTGEPVVKPTHKAIKASLPKSVKELAE